MSTAPGRAGVAIVRVSGGGALTVLATLAPGLARRPRVAQRVQLRAADGGLIDDGLALAFPAPASFTGENVVEFHVHGSPAVLEALFAALRATGARVAEAGEFTRRAFANGKMDLTAAEGLADLIASDSDVQRKQALAQMGGAWSRQIDAWTARLLDALAWLEAAIDFSDEDDVPADVSRRAEVLIAGTVDDMAQTLEDGRRGEIVRDGLRVAIIGPPNVGKSTLLNALAGRDAAIVSDIPGTTRDVVEVRLDLDGYVVILADTAGLRETLDPIEREGVRRGRLRASEADLRVWVLDAATDGRTRVGLETDEAWRPGDIVFWNKLDLGCPEGAAAGDLSGCVRDGVGLEDLLGVIRSRLGGAAEPTLITRARHRDALVSAIDALRRALMAPPDLAAEDVRGALWALGRISGRYDVESVLDRIFSSFCIGK